MYDFIYEFTQQEFMRIMAITLFPIGIISIFTGNWILITRALNKDFQKISAQTSKLARKGLADDISGLVGNASNLLTAMNQMVLTATGIGVFLNLVGLALIVGAGWLTLKIY